MNIINFNGKARQIAYDKGYKDLKSIDMIEYSLRWEAYLEATEPLFKIKYNLLSQITNTLILDKKGKVIDSKYNITPEIQHIFDQIGELYKFWVTYYGLNTDG